MMGFNQYSLVSTWGEFFLCSYTHAHRNVPWWKSKIKWCKTLMTLLGPYYVMCVYTKMHMKEQVHAKSWLNSVCVVTLVLWFVTAEDSWNMNRKNAHNIFTSHIFPTNTRLLGCIYHLLGECLDVFFTHLFLHGKWNGSHLLTQTSSIICCFDLYCFPNVTYSLQLRYLLWNQKASNNSPQK